MAYILFNIDKIQKSLTLVLLSILWLQIQAQNVYTLQPAGFCPPPAGSGTLTGNTCFDVAVSNDNANGCGALSGRTATKSDFTQSATNTQTYTFTPSGTVSNVRFVFVNTNGNVVLGTSGGNSGNNISTAVTGIVNYNTNLNTLATGTTTSTALTADIYAVYNINATNDNNPTNDRIVKLTVQVKDCACCGAYSFVSDAASQPSTNPKTWLSFMCHNLGADQSLDPFTYVVGNADGSGGTLGYLYQWGRPADGHQLRNSPTTATLSTTDAPGHNKFIIPSTGNWRNPASNVLWGDGTSNRNMAKKPNDPCPAGYKVPSALQWGSIAWGGSSWTSQFYATMTANTYTLISGQGVKIGNNLFLPFAGYRDWTNAAVGTVGTFGQYWSSTVSGANAQKFEINNTVGTVMQGLLRGQGASVRCVAE